MNHNHHHHHEGAHEAPAAESPAQAEPSLDLNTTEGRQQYVKDNLVETTIEAPDRHVEILGPVDLGPYEGEAVEETPTEYPSGVFAEAAPEEEHHREVDHNDLFIKWMRAKYPKHMFFDTKEHSIVDIIAGLPVVSSDWKVLQRGLFQKLAQKLLQTTFMPYLMDGETVPFLTPKFNYLAYVIIQNAAVTFNVHVIVPQGTPGAILPPFPVKEYPTQTLLLLGLPDLGPRAMEIKVLREAEPAMRVLATPVISMTQALTEQNRFGLGRGCLRYTAPPQPRGRQVKRNQGQAAMALAMMAGAMAPNLTKK